MKGVGFKGSGLLAGIVFALCVLAGWLAVAAPAQAGFGLREFDVAFPERNGSPDFQAGSHPFAIATSLRFDSFPTGKGGEEAEQQARDIIVSLPPGFIGNPTAVPRCSDQQFATGAAEGPQRPACPDATAIGVDKVQLANEFVTGPIYSAVYNLQPPPGVAAKIGFWVGPVPVPIELGISETAPYQVVGGPTKISQVLEVLGAELTIWGDPADPAHDALRGGCLANNGESLGSCPANVSARPYLTLPRACNGPLASSYAIDSWQQPGAVLANRLPDLSDPSWLTGFALTHDNAEPPVARGMIGCAGLGFRPTVGATPTTRSASSPTGLDFTLDIDDEGLTNPTGIAGSDLKKAVVALPEGMTANPALAEGLKACSETDLARETIDSTPGEGCPGESKIGTVEVQTPLLEQTLTGALFLATPYENPFGSLLALYVVVKNPETGVLLKLPGEVVPDQTTGQLVSVFDDLPQLPFSHFRLHFREGQRSPLVTPPGCGAYTTQADLTPWANPESVLHEIATFQITSGIAGGPCPASGAAPFKPGLDAGTVNNQAGSYSPMSIRITRNDSEQEITGFSSLLPPGVTANLTGVPFCSEAQIAAAQARGGKQTGGGEEQADPSCPAASEIGHSLVGVGVGSVLAYNPGKLYMAGPYEGAPFSVVAITAAKVGPFDLGTVVVHLPLQIDPITAQVSIPAGAADQIPHIIKGIVVHVRDIQVYVDKRNFTLNPTNCEPLSLSATVYGAGRNLVSPADDVPSTVTSRFQAANCANLQFKPIFKASTAGKTSRADGASLHVTLAYPTGSLGKAANVRSVKVSLPKRLPSRLTTLQKACTSAQFQTNPAGCPAGSRVGTAKAITPILPVPLEGPAYFVSYGGAKFPELVIVLQGYGVTIDLHGETFINAKTNVTSSTFHTVPDQPVTSFELTLPQGPNSALAAPTGLCNTTATKTVKKKITLRAKNGHKHTITRKTKTTIPASLLMPTTFTAQNGAVLKQNTPIRVTGCAKAKKKAKKSRRARRAAGTRRR